MIALIALLGIAACAVAEPITFIPSARYLYPQFQQPLFRSPYSPVYYPGLREFYPGAYPYAVRGYPYYAGVKSMYHEQDFLGQARYGHVEPGQRQDAIQDAFGNKVGSFSYYNPDGKLIQTSYIADGAGYRVTSNDLPIAPENKLVVPEDTPEVAAAKIAHLKEVEAAKTRSKRDAPFFPQGGNFQFTPSVNPVDSTFAFRSGAPLTSQAFLTLGSTPRVTKEGFLEETPEVIAAKAQHFAEHSAATARNLAAPPAPVEVSFTPRAETVPQDYRFLSSLSFGQQINQGAPTVNPQGFLANTPQAAAVGRAEDFSKFFTGLPQTVNTQGFLANTPQQAAGVGRADFSKFVTGLPQGGQQFF